MSNDYSGSLSQIEFNESLLWQWTTYPPENSLKHLLNHQDNIHQVERETQELYETLESDTVAELQSAWQSSHHYEEKYEELKEKNSQLEAEIEKSDNENHKLQSKLNEVLDRNILRSTNPILND